MSDCQRRVLSEAPVGRLEICRCGTVHLVVGPVTLRLPAAAVPALRDLLDRALRTDPLTAPLAGSADDGPSARRRSSVH